MRAKVITWIIPVTKPARITVLRLRALSTSMLDEIPLTREIITACKGAPGIKGTMANTLAVVSSNDISKLANSRVASIGTAENGIK
jgi:hypothetical protein